MEWHRAALAMCAVAVSLLIIACDRTHQHHEPPKPLGQRNLLIGLIPEQNVFRQRERYMLIQNYLSDDIGVTVNFTSLTRHGNVVERFNEEKLDGAILGSFTYALAHDQLGVEALARPVNLDGTSTYHGYIFVRKDSGIRTIAEMKGKKFAFVERATTAGYLFPLAYFQENKIADLHIYLGNSYFTGSHDAAIVAVLNREADIGAAKNTIYDALAAENPRIEKEMVILAASGAVPQSCFVVRKGLDPELKSAIKKSLLNMDKNSRGIEVLRKFGARGFVETTMKDYDYLYQLAKHVGVDFKTYQYQNR